MRFQSVLLVNLYYPGDKILVRLRTFLYYTHLYTSWMITLLSVEEKMRALCMADDITREVEQLRTNCAPL